MYIPAESYYLRNNYRPRRSKRNIRVIVRAMAWLLALVIKEIAS